jgi:phosphate transport system substrate-binding protein
MTALMRAAVFAALVFSGLCQRAFAQDVTLTSRDGALAISGLLQGYDGEFYRIDSAYGLLTIDAQGVICDGPACPDLTAPKAMIRIVGAPEAGAALVPGLIAGFAKHQGLTLTTSTSPDAPMLLSDPATNKVLAEFSFQPLPPAAAHEALAAGRAELVLASTSDPAFGVRTIGLDPLVAISATDNPLPRLATSDLARALTGDLTNWADLGGPDMPLVLHGLAEGADMNRALSDRLGRKIAATVVHDTPADLAKAVARDPWALAVTGRSLVGPAQPLDLTDSCGFPLSPTPLAVKAEDYPLTLPVYFLTPRRRLPLVAREFLDYLPMPTAQDAVEMAGYVGRSLEQQPIAADGLRLINAIQNAGEETTLADLQSLVAAMQGAERVSFTFRFQDGRTEMEPYSRDSLVDLARLIEIGAFSGKTVVLAGFSDGSGAADANRELSLQRADQVLHALQQAAPGLAQEALPQVAAFGEALPMACDETSAGRRLNRRVEVWITPAFRKDTTP